MKNAILFIFSQVLEKNWGRLLKWDWLRNRLQGIGYKKYLVSKKKTNKTRKYPALVACTRSHTLVPLLWVGLFLYFIIPYGGSGSGAPETATGVLQRHQERGRGSVLYHEAVCVCERERERTVFLHHLSMCFGVPLFLFSWIYIRSGLYFAQLGAFLLLGTWDILYI